MRASILIALLPCALLAQTRPADRDVFQQLQQRLDWFQAGTHSPQGEWKVRLLPPRTASKPGVDIAAALPPRTCSIPLLRVTTAGRVIDHMSLPTPPGKDFDPKFVLPTPPVCEAWKP